MLKATPAVGRRAHLEGAGDLGPHAEEVAEDEADGGAAAAPPVQLQQLQPADARRRFARQAVLLDEVLGGLADAVDPDDLIRSWVADVNMREQIGLRRNDRHDTTLCPKFCRNIMSTVFPQRGTRTRFGKSGAEMLSFSNGPKNLIKFGCISLR